MVERLSHLVGIFQKPELDFSQNRAENDDILGDAYEYFYGTGIPACILVLDKENASARVLDKTGVFMVDAAKGFNSMSIFNISGMSFGALSAPAISVHHRHGGDLVWQIASGYFGCRSDDGHFDPVRFAEQARDPAVKLIEVKLSQGAKPGHGGVLPAAKLSADLCAPATPAHFGPG